MEKSCIIGVVLFAMATTVLGQTDANNISDHNNILIKNPESVKTYLKGEDVQYDKLWIPAEIDVSKYKILFKEYLQKNADVNTSTDNKYILENFDKYKLQYSGFVKNSKKYLIFNMISLAIDINDKEFAFVFDGGCGVVRVVIDVENNQIVRIECNMEV
ncbi:MAG: hypothetical protein A2Y12_16785 [Planctomycetes bacterium GWF2_42_9]|nr:MAG: hypothetical protein A2Y12_16785 [Planctomycetes bacterium GWF2_42_9]HAL44514.1 hypothetical protein [Phycisphaerales bacterium]